MTIKEAFEALSSACAKGMKNPFFVMKRLKESFADVADKVVDASGDKVTVTPITDSGTKIAEIKVNNTTSDLYAPAASSGIDYSTTEQDTGLKWIDGKKIYQKTIDFTSDITIAFNSWTATTESSVGISLVLNAFAPSYGSIMCGINPTNNVLQFQTPRNGDTVETRYITIQYIKS